MLALIFTLNSLKPSENTDLMDKNMPLGVPTS